MRYYLEILRSLFLKGVGTEVLWPQMAMLLIIGAFMLVSVFCAIGSG